MQWFVVAAFHTSERDHQDEDGSVAPYPHCFDMHVLQIIFDNDDPARFATVYSAH